MNVTEIEDIEDASKTRREGEKARTMSISQDCEAKTAFKEAYKVINGTTSMFTVALCNVSVVCGLSGKSRGTVVLYHNTPLEGSIPLWKQHYEVKVISSSV